MQRAEVWLKRYARPVEVARWEFLFAGGTNERVFDYLAAFQNEDGGFGHGLEPDFWLPQSSPMATWTAGQILLEAKATPNHPVVRKLLAYLLKTPQVQPGMWPSVLPENNLHPHAPWWQWEEGVQRNWMFNPSVELAAMMIDWSPLESDAACLGWESLGHAFRHLMQVTAMERHELQNYRASLRLLHPHRASFNARLEYAYEQVQAKVQSLVKDTIDRDVANWGEGYKPLPLDFIHSPEDPLFEELKPLVERNLDFYLEQRTGDGLWNITWNWGQSPDSFSIARRYWQGIVAIERYKVLRAFHRI